VTPVVTENNGTLVNMDNSDWVSGKSGTALDFDGINDRLILEIQILLILETILPFRMVYNTFILAEDYFL